MNCTSHRSVMAAGELVLAAGGFVFRGQGVLRGQTVRCLQAPEKHPLSPS